MKAIWDTTIKTHFILVSVYLVLIDGAIFTSQWRWDRRFTWSFEPREGLAICRAKGVSSFLRYLKTRSTGPSPGIEPAISRSAVKRTIDWASQSGTDPIGLSRWWFCHHLNGNICYRISSTDRANPLLRSSLRVKGFNISYCFTLSYVIFIVLTGSRSL